MNQQLKIKRIERDIVLQKEAFELLQTIIKQPATGMLLGLASAKGMYKLGLFSGPELALISALITSGTMVSAFKPITVAGVG